MLSKKICNQITLYRNYLIIYLPLVFNTAFKISMFMDLNFNSIRNTLKYLSKQMKTFLIHNL